ncbi:hypothetical protein [Methylocystis sp. SC2]|uniref:hypothetical protein n=1 Tax=Methylocystis sp. (strain SC2) TaxID=187303 RepID=UPI00027AEF3E|nr:hypothetical protein [Methylocystis sp. SC2]CCJ07044.1 Hypothetical protein BN69_1593 [Methylocystis sp. SC2]
MSASSFAKLTLDERRAALQAASLALNAAVGILRPHVALFEAFKQERADMESFGPVLAPGLYLDREKRAVSDLMAPLYEAGQRLVETFDTQIEAVVEQASQRAETMDLKR